MSNNIKSPDLSSAAASAESPPNRLKVWTLQYTKLGLVMVFFWLLWGDFTFSLMEAVIPSILPLKLQSLGSSNMAMGIIMGTIPSAMNFMINPIVSFRSDRFRSRWGRRIPFLFLATPGVTFALIMMAFSADIGQWVHAQVGAHHWALSAPTVAVVMIGILMIMFQFFNMFIATVYYYLFNDVVPEHFVARFLGLFRMVGTLAGMLYNWLLFKHAQTHMREIFVFVALLYFVGFMLMCWRVKEGKYPPPPPLDGNRKGFWASVTTYCRESFTHPFYLCTFAFSACMTAAGVCGFAVNLFFLHLGITLEQLGHFRTYIAIPGIVLALPLAWLVDRLHPVRVVLWAVLIMAITNIIGFFALHDYKSMLIISVIAIPDGILYGVAIMPMGMMLWPKDRYGQFGSADAAVKSVVAIVMGFGAGIFLDFMKRMYNGNEAYYRWIYIWSASFQLLAFVMMLLVYRYWKKHGGAEGFKSPSVSAVEKSVPETGSGIPRSVTATEET